MIYRPVRQKRWKVFEKKRKPLTTFSSSLPVSKRLEETGLPELTARQIKAALCILGIIIFALLIWEKLPKRVISPLPKRPPIQLFFSYQL